MSTLEEIKKAKDVDIEKYKKYLNKAKKIIENIGENKSQGPDDSLEVSRHITEDTLVCVTWMSFLTWQPLILFAQGEYNNWPI